MLVFTPLFCPSLANHLQLTSSSYLHPQIVCSDNCRLPSTCFRINVCVPTVWEISHLSWMDRPPPHPPPQCLTTMVVITITEALFERPPRKPPWKHFVCATPSLLGLCSNVLVAAFLVSFLCLFSCVLVSVFCLKFWPRVFDVLLEKDLFHRHYILNGFMAAFTKFSMLSTLQKFCQYVVESVISETTYSRFERTPSNILFRSWMKLKNVDFELWLTFSHMWKILVWLLRSVYWFVNALLSFESSTCILAIFITSIDLKIWWNALNA